MPDPAPSDPEQNGGHDKVAPRCESQGGFVTEMGTYPQLLLSELAGQMSRGWGEINASQRRSADIAVKLHATPPTETVALGPNAGTADRSTIGDAPDSVSENGAADDGRDVEFHAACTAARTTSGDASASARVGTGLQGRSKTAFSRSTEVMLINPSPLSDREKPLRKSEVVRQGTCDR